ncbi:helix-turn-helix transcriptional regulator [Gimesia chilikensis]|uniref:helix-turn-helix domain-containing protein n=1 Tax=Gimesia chilikensis TaxID=2605989 RepID=UPI0011EC8283|nr:XRE family transcriptional regulator [Gimesia chilikensis]KAA0134151.1 helix-turn-helix transcriptional regulator [Gimesia chilikensis]
MAAPSPGKQTASKPTAELSPDEISGQLSQRVRTLRKERGWSLDSLSAACGVSRSMLSQIERGEANPTLAVTVRISQAFGIALGELVEAPISTSSIEVIRADDRTFHYRSDDECRIRTLSPLHLEKDVEFYEVQLHSNGKLQSAPHFKGTREFLTVEKGKIELQSGDDTTVLGPGDSASYRVDVPHTIRNAGRGEAMLFLVVIYQN